MTNEHSLDPLRQFVRDMTKLVDAGAGSLELVDRGEPMMAKLVADDSWLPADFAKPHPQYYQQYLLHCDPLERFSVVSFVWGPGQKTPIHDHTVWGLIGVLSGGELETRFDLVDGALQAGEVTRLEPGHVGRLSEDDGDVHQVANAFEDRVSISIHVYGGNIGKVRRHVFDPQTGAMKDFISSYSSNVMPNIWA
ncbi:MAG: cysteine dioxygenase [Rhizobiaceae bacterium]|nr:cysteine dioxygenase [Rhizobiaceae bacterium]